jgi:NTE family protein
MGAIVAAGVATRTDEELDAFYAQPDRIHRTAIRLLGPTGIRTHRALLDPGTLRDHVASNIGDFTFLEAHVRTGRVLNVSISPTRARQKPRVLSHRTAPDVLIVDATVASCSIPGLFPPVSLRARGADGRTEPYVPTEKWVDGSMHGDLPMQRLARLHNVNHFIVSQANPFVLPFVAMPHHGPLRTAMRLAGSVARAQAAAVLDEVRLRVHGGRLRPWLDTAHALAGQAYGAEINIHPRVTPAQYPRVMSNPTEPELRGYIVGGERATWPRIPLIRVQTAIARTLESCIDRLAAEP